MPETGTIIQTLGILRRTDLVLASPSSIYSFHKQIYYDEITFQIKNGQDIKVIDCRASIDYLHGRNKIEGFALLKLRSKLENKHNIELSSYIDQIKMLDLISIETKKTEISSFLIIRIELAQYKTNKI